MLLWFSKNEKISLGKFPVFFFGPYLSWHICSLFILPVSLTSSPAAISWQQLLNEGWVGEPLPVYVIMLASLTLCRSCTGAHNCCKFISAIIMPCPKRFLPILSVEDTVSGWLSLPVCMWSVGRDCIEVLLSARKKYCTFSSSTFYTLATRHYWFVRKLSSFLLLSSRFCVLCHVQILASYLSCRNPSFFWIMSEIVAIIPLTSL